MPTLSVILCAHNEERHLAEQLAAIVHQTRPPDELVFLDDGSTDGTAAIADACLFPHLIRIKTFAPSGCNRAYNIATAAATGEWIFLAGAHDVVQQGAFAAWERAAVSFPKAAIIAGDVNDQDLTWLDREGYWPAEELYLRMLRHKGIPCLHGQAMFWNRRFYQPENEALRWLADFWAYHCLALRHSVVFIRTLITNCRRRPNDHSEEYRDEAKLAKVKIELARLLSLPENADVRDKFIASRLIEMPHGGGGSVRTMLMVPS